MRNWERVNEGTWPQINKVRKNNQPFTAAWIYISFSQEWSTYSLLLNKYSWYKSFSLLRGSTCSLLLNQYSTNWEGQRPSRLLMTAMKRSSTSSYMSYNLKAIIWIFFHKNQDLSRNHRQPQNIVSFCSMAFEFQKTQPKRISKSCLCQPQGVAWWSRSETYRKVSGSKPLRCYQLLWGQFAFVLALSGAPASGWWVYGPQD